MKFNPFIYVLKVYLSYAVPICFMLAIMTCLYPFLGYGPIFPYLTNKFFVKNCNKYWYTDILFINDIYPWET